MGFLDKIFKNQTPAPTTDNQKPSSPLRSPRNSNSCPNCGTVFEKAPKRKTQCKDCGEIIYVRSKQELFDSDLLREDQAQAADFYGELIEYGATLEDYQSTRKELAEKWGLDPNPYDIVWSVSNKMIVKGPNLDGVYDKQNAVLFNAKMITFSQAKYQLYRGIDPASYQRTCNEYDVQIAELGGLGINEFEVLAQGCCPKCDVINKKKFTADEIKAKHILPQKVCTSKLEKHHKFPWCICMYLPIIPGRE